MITGGICQCAPKHGFSPLQQECHRNAAGKVGVRNGPGTVLLKKLWWGCAALQCWRVSVLGERSAQPTPLGQENRFWVDLFTGLYLLVKPGMKVSGDETSVTETKQKLLAVQTEEKGI